MSREIMERILRLIEQFALDYHRKECAAQISSYVERLLADERERLQDEIQAYQSDPGYDNRYLQGQDDMRKRFEKLLHAEREKVRKKTLLELDENCDMCGNPLGDAVCVSCVNQRVGAAVEECANRVKSFALAQEADIVKYQGNLTRRDVAGIIGARFAGSLVDEIRQLDLTKDLAPSSREEK